MSSAARKFTYGCSLLLVAVAVLQLTLPCHVWRWAVGVPGLAAAAVLLYLGPVLHRQRRLSFEEYRLLEFFGGCLLFGSFAALIGWFC